MYERYRHCVVGNSSKDPRCFRCGSCPLRYMAQKNAWVDYIFIPWFLTIFLLFLRSFTSFPVAVLLENAGSHRHLRDPIGQVTLFYLPLIAQLDTNLSIDCWIDCFHQMQGQTHVAIESACSSPRKRISQKSCGKEVERGAWE